MPQPAVLNRRDFVATVGAVGGSLLAAPGFAAEPAAKVTLALLGAAHMHTPLFLQILKSREDVTVKHVYDRDAARAAKWAGVCGAKVAQTPGAILGDPSVSGVVILSETSLHAELATAAAAAKKHVFVEKPLSASSTDARAIATAVEKAGVLFTTGYHLRTLPKHIFIKEQIAQGNLGRIVRVYASFCNDCILQGAFDSEFQWTVQRRYGAMGSFADTGTHALDLLMWLLGDVEAVAAEIRSVTGRYPDCDESGQGLLRFKNGVTGTLAAGWIEPENPVSLQVNGTAGHAVVLNDRLYLRTKKVAGADGARPWGKLPAGPEHPLLQFVAAIAGAKDQPLVSVREAAARVCVMEACYQAAREGRSVKLS